MGQANSTAKVGNYTTSTFDCDLINNATALDRLDKNTTIDSDIVGPGMLAAFFVSTTAAIIVVIFAYLFQAVDDASVNYLDTRVQSAIQQWWYRIFPKRKERRQSMESEVVSIGLIRKDAIIQFLLSLSDQQLITGLAILIAGVWRFNDFTRFEWVGIHNLAWFASTTHLATLDVLGYYFRPQRAIRLIRTIAIIAFVILLTYVFMIRALAAMDGCRWSIPVRCVFHDGQVGIAPCSNWGSDFYILWQCAWMLALFIVLVGYMVRIQDFYISQRHPLYILGWLLWTLKHRRNAGKPYHQIYAERKAALQLERIFRISTRVGWERFVWAFQGYSDSFLSTIPGIVFSFSYAIAQVATVTWGQDLPFPSSAHSSNYGQIVSLLLFCLCFVAAGETVSNFRLKRKLRLSTTESDPFPTMLDTKPAGLPVVPRRASAEVFEYAGLLDSEYESSLPTLMVYFCKEVNDIAESERDLGRNSAVVEARKEALLAQLEVVRQFQLGRSRVQLGDCEDLPIPPENLDIRPQVLCFLVNTFGAIAAGVLLNSAHFNHTSPSAHPRIYAGIGLLLAFLSVKLVLLCNELLAILNFDVR